MTSFVEQKVLMQALVDGEIQNTVRTRLNLCSRQGETSGEKELHKQRIGDLFVLGLLRNTTRAT